jgi:hypothetical protein
MRGLHVWLPFVCVTSENGCRRITCFSAAVAFCGPLQKACYAFNDNIDIGISRLYSQKPIITLFDANDSNKKSIELPSIILTQSAQVSDDESFRGFHRTGISTQEPLPSETLRIEHGSQPWLRS